MNTEQTIEVKEVDVASIVKIEILLSILRGVSISGLFTVFNDEKITTLLNGFYIDTRLISQRTETLTLYKLILKIDKNPLVIKTNDQDLKKARNIAASAITIKKIRVWVDTNIKSLSVRVETTEDFDIVFDIK
jgi:hypothetical protein